MVLPIHRLRHFGWEGKMSVATLKIFHGPQKTCFYFFGQFLVKISHLFGGFSAFFIFESCSAYLPDEGSFPSRVPQKPFVFQSLSALLMFPFLPSRWMWVCKLNQPEYQFDVHYVLFNLFKHVLHYPFWSGPGPSHVLFILTWGKMTCLKHANTMNLGVCVRPHPQKVWLHRPSTRKRCPLPSGPKKQPHFIGLGAQQKGLELWRFPPPWFPSFDRYGWGRQQKVQWTKKISCYGSLSLIWFEHTL